MSDRIKQSKQIFEGRVFNLRQVELVEPDGRRIERQVVEHPGGVTILPVLDEEHLVLIRNERFSIGKTLWELPAGTLETGEAVEDCAARELIEETGYQAQRIERLTSFYSTPGFCDERLHVFAAYDLTEVGQQLDETENITVEVVSFEKTMQMIETGEIEDGKTIAAVLYYRTFIKEGK